MRNRDKYDPRICRSAEMLAAVLFGAVGLLGGAVIAMLGQFGCG